MSLHKLLCTSRWQDDSLLIKHVSIADGHIMLIKELLGFVMKQNCFEQPLRSLRSQMWTTHHMACTDTGLKT